LFLGVRGGGVGSSDPTFEQRGGEDGHRLKNKGQRGLRRFPIETLAPSENQTFSGEKGGQEIIGRWISPGRLFKEGAKEGS